MKALVIYHDNCADGFTAAWVAWLHFGDNAEYMPAQYGDTPPDCTGREVYVLDFSYRRDQMIEMAKQAYSIHVIDHHKTAQQELKGLSFCTFDMNLSGAALAWRYFIGYEYLPLPALVCYVQDRDLWKWELRDSKEVNAYIATVSKCFHAWGLLSDELHLCFDSVVERGATALDVVERYVEGKIKQAGELSIGGVMVPCVNTTFAISEVVGALAEGRPFAAGWFQRDDGRFVYSLRSRGDGGADVSEIAKRYGGGGHRNAAGFTSETLISSCWRAAPLRARGAKP